MTAATHHTILLSFSRELRFDVQGGKVRAAYYVPAIPRDELRKLARQANAGNLKAITKIQAAGKDRTTAYGSSVGEALMHARNLDHWDAECRQVDDYAALMGWQPAGRAA